MEILALVLHHDKQALGAAVELALDGSSPSHREKVQRGHRLEKSLTDILESAWRRAVAVPISRFNSDVDTLNRIAAGKPTATC